MSKEASMQCTAFVGEKRVASGTRAEVARAVRAAISDEAHRPVTVFDDATSEIVELDLRGSLRDVEERYAVDFPAGDDAGGGGNEPVLSAPRRPGRPKLGVVGKEVTLLPRHWAWLGAQRGGASVTLRKLVDQARRGTAAADESRRATDAAYRFMHAMVGDHPGFEEATRALYAGDRQRFYDESDAWPDDLKDHVRMLAQPAFGRDWVADATNKQ
jgi:hypothetical protein